MSGPERLASGDGANFRRGALMGFTVAESFMLIAFALLLLLALWRYADNERLTWINTLSREQQQAVVAASRDGTLDLLLALGRDPASRSALGAGAQIVERARLDSLEEAARLVAEDEIRRLAEAAAAMPEEARRRLTDLVRLEDYRDALEKLDAAKALGDGAVIVGPEEMQRLRDALEVAEKVEEGRLHAGDVEQQVAANITARTGPLIASMGGEITQTGDVVLPDTLLFASGSSEITLAMRDFLDGFCRPWFEILHEVGPSLSSVQIEGHASSEWTGLSPEQAYLENLRLSQERARAVFSFCLRQVGGGDIGSWARERLAAVGYSSARRIIDDGQEDRARSRRVVFSIDADRSTVLERIDAAKAPR